MMADNVYKMDSETRGLISDQLKISGVKSMASGFAGIANAMINYSALKVEAGNMNLQANSIELQAQEAANNLRRQFIGAVGSATYNAAIRGVKVSSANLQQNIERSSGEMDEDIRKSKKNASMKAANLRTQAKIMKRTAKAQRFSGILGGISDIMGGVASYGAGSDIGGEDMSGQSSNWNPLKSAPSRKPTRG